MLFQREASDSNHVLIFNETLLLLNQTGIINLVNSLIFVLTSKPSTATPTQQNANAKTTDEFNYISLAPPPPVEFADESYGEFPTTTTTSSSSSTRFRPHSVNTLFNNDSQTGSSATTTKHVSASPDWHKSFKFLLNHGANASCSSSGKKSNCSSTSPNVTPTKSNANVKKQASIRSKGGFSIPLNASYCVTNSNFTTPINERRGSYAPNNSNGLVSNSEILNLKCTDDLVTQNPSSFYAIKNKLQQEYLYQQHLINNKNNKRSFTKKADVDEDVTMHDYDDKENDENCILFPINSFDLKEANSCLKEVNLRLKYAQINNIDDEFNDETLPHQQNSNSISKPKTSSTTASPSSLSSSSSIDSSSLPPSVDAAATATNNLSDSHYFRHEQENEPIACNKEEVNSLFYILNLMPC